MKKIGPKNPFGVTDPRVPPATEAQVRALEKRLGAPLPADYRTFLMTINGGSRPGGGWDLPRLEINIDTFYGLRGDHYDLADAVDRVLRSEEGTTSFSPDTIPIGYELTGNPILMKYRGDEAGSIWFWDERPKPPALLRKLVQNSKNLEKDKPTEQRREIIQMLEARIETTADKEPRTVRKLNLRRK